MIKNPLTPAQINLTKGRNYLRCEKYTQAETILQELINTELSKESVDSTFKAETCLYLGEVEYHIKEYHDSIQTLNKVFSFSDVNKEWIKPRAHLYLGNCYRDIGETEKAKQEYDIAYEFKGNALRLEVDKARSGMK
jgi:tetratricopeptide (TPR) repeat protein